MASRDLRVDAYIQDSADFPKPILTHLRVSDLPSNKVLTGYIKKAMKLHEEIAKSPPRAKAKAKKQSIKKP